MNTQNTNTSKRFNRAQIEWMKCYDAFEFKIVDYLIFTSYPKEQASSSYQFHVNKVARETKTSKGKVSGLFVKFKKSGCLTKFGEGKKSYFIFNYSKCYSYSVNQLKIVNAGNTKNVSENSETLSIMNSVVHPVNDTVHNGNETVHGAIPISNREVIKEVKDEVPKNQVGNNTEEYNKLLNQIDYSKQSKLISEMESLIKSNEQVLQANNDYELYIILLEQCKTNKIDADKRKNSAFKN